MKSKKSNTDNPLPGRSTYSVTVGMGYAPMKKLHKEFIPGEKCYEENGRDPGA